MPDINDIYCCKCGKFILTEEKGNDDEIRCVKGSYEDGYYVSKEYQFYCRECAEKYNKE